MTTGISKASAKCSVCSGELLKKQDPVYVKYQTYRNTLKKIKRKAKEEYYKNLIQKHQTYANMEILNSIAGRLNDKSSISDTFIINDKKVTDAKTIYNEFC